MPFVELVGVSSDACVFPRLFRLRPQGLESRLRQSAHWPFQISHHKVSYDFRVQSRDSLAFRSTVSFGWSWGILALVRNVVRVLQSFDTVHTLYTEVHIGQHFFCFLTINAWPHF